MRKSLEDTWRYLETEGDKPPRQSAQARHLLLRAGVLGHFDTEAIHALIAPRPHLELSGDQDGGAPTDGIEVLEKKLGSLYRLYGKAENFRSVIYKDTGHEYLPEMKDEMLPWFTKHLPVQK